jgi:hypothetical protein
MKNKTQNLAVAEKQTISLPRQRNTTKLCRGQGRPSILKMGIQSQFKI